MNGNTYRKHKKYRKIPHEDKGRRGLEKKYQAHADCQIGVVKKNYASGVSHWALVCKDCNRHIQFVDKDTASQVFEMLDAS